MLEGDEDGTATGEQIRRVLTRARHKAPVIGITGTGGAGKSSLTDELLARLVRALPDLLIAVVAMDPTRRRSGGALLGDRIRMNVWPPNRSSCARWRPGGRISRPQPY